MVMGISSTREVTLSSVVLVPKCLKPTSLRVVRPLTQQRLPPTLTTTQAPKVLFITPNLGVVLFLLIIKMDLFRPVKLSDWVPRPIGETLFPDEPLVVVARGPSLRVLFVARAFSLVKVNGPRPLDPPTRLVLT